jgi:hypothetical protein
MRPQFLLKFLSIAAIVTISQSTFAQEASYVVKGVAEKLTRPAKAYMMYRNASGKQLDSADIIGGKFTFHGTNDQPRPAVIYISKTGAGLESSGYDYVLFYLESGVIEINTTNSLDSAIVAGGPINTDNNQLNILLQDNNAEFKKLRKAYAAISSEQKNAKGVIDSLNKRNKLLLASRKSIYLVFIRKHPNSMMSLFALQNFERPVANVIDIEPLLICSQQISAKAPQGKVTLPRLQG